MSASGRLALLLSVILALAGAALSASLTSAHLSGGGGLLALDCSNAESGCGQVMASRWAVFPPADPADVVDGPAQTGVPVAALGLLYFAALAVWLGFVGVCRGARAAWNGVVLQCLGVGCVVSVLYAVLMLTQLDALCPLCLGSHLANLAMFGCFFVAVRSLKTGEHGATTEPANHPAPRLALAVLTLGPCLGALLWVALDAQASEAALQSQGALLANLDAKAELVELAYFSDTRFSGSESGQQRFDASLRPENPEIAATDGASMTLVVYSDAECPSCGRFETMLTDEILPLFGGHLRVVYKHFPLTIHLAAEPAARALEAARLQGSFWEYKALLDEQRGQLDDVDHGALAATLGLDVERFTADWTSPAAALRVAEDVRDGQNLGVDGTPTVFLNRRLVDPLTRGLLGFWSRRAQVLRDARASQNQTW